MPMPSVLEVCRTDFYSSEEDLRRQYPPTVADRVLRLREEHQWLLGTPHMRDSQLVACAVDAYGISRVTAYSDLKILKELLPHLTEATAAFHRWRYNEMALDIIAAAREKGDLTLAERAIAGYARVNGADRADDGEETHAAPPPQPFMATDDPRVLGIEPIPDIQDQIRRMIDKYSADITDIQDVEFEEVDLELDDLFGDIPGEDTAAAPGDAEKGGEERWTI